MPPPSSKPPRWSGPALTLVGVLVLTVVLLRPGAEASPLSWWIANSVLRPDRVFPLIGLAVALGLMPPLSIAAGALAFIAGIALGFAFYEPLLAPLWAMPQAAESSFFTGPVAALAAGLTLIVPSRLRDRIVVPLALLAGIAAALAIVVTDPSIRGPGNRIAGVLIALWLVAAVALTVRAFRRSWFDTAGRILGSWLIAVALLYGGAALLPPRAPPPQPPASPRKQDTRDTSTEQWGLRRNLKSILGLSLRPAGGLRSAAASSL